MGLMLGEFVDEYTVKVGGHCWPLAAKWLALLVDRLARCALPAAAAAAAALPSWLLLLTPAAVAAWVQPTAAAAVTVCSREDKLQAVACRRPNNDPCPAVLLQVVDVFAMPQSGTGVSVEAVDPVFQTKMLDMLKQVGRCGTLLPPPPLPPLLLLPLLLSPVMRCLRPCLLQPA